MPVMSNCNMGGGDGREGVGNKGHGKEDEVYLSNKYISQREM